MGDGICSDRHFRDPEAQTRAMWRPQIFHEQQTRRDLPVLRRPKRQPSRARFAAEFAGLVAASAASTAGRARCSPWS